MRPGLRLETALCGFPRTEESSRPTDAGSLARVREGLMALVESEALFGGDGRGRRRAKGGGGRGEVR